MLKNILVSGGAGFIGSNLALSLIAKGYAVTVLDNLSKQVHGENKEKSYLFNLIKNKVIFISGDVRNSKDWEKALEGQDAVIHLAAETGTAQSMYQISKYSDVNVGGTALLLDYFANTKHKIKKIIVASSRAIYGEGRYYCSFDGEVYPIGRNEKDLINGDFDCKCPVCGGDINVLPTHENAKTEAQSIYGILKYNQEQLILVAGKALSIPAVALRYQNVYGPGQSLTNPYTGILSIFSAQIKNNHPINIYEDGKESRDFVYIDDVVNATILSLEKESADYNVYNVGSGIPVTVLQIANTLVRLYRSDCKINVTGNFRAGDIRHNFADLIKIKRDINYFPQIKFEDGISNFVKWVQTQKLPENLYTKSITELKTRGLYK